MRIAILQRDPVYCKSIEKIIIEAGHACLTYQDGLTLSKALAHSTVDMLILDWHGMRLAGGDILKSVRSVGGDQLPVMFASMDGSEESMVRAFTFGADDYVTLPLRPFEFRARVRALLRRAYPERHGAARFDCGPYHFDTVRDPQSLTQ